MAYFRHHILVIRLSAFGDICLSLGTFEKIRAAHPQAHITLLTTPPFTKLLAGCPAFDAIDTITRWGIKDIREWLRFYRGLRQKDYDLVYDLQDNDRTRWFRWLSPARMRRNWLRVRLPLARQNLRDFQGDTVDTAACAFCPPQDLNWLSADISAFNVPEKSVLIVPGCAPQHPGKRWPAAHYATLAQRLAERGITPVLIGTESEGRETSAIAAACPEALDLTGKTAFGHIAALARQAKGAVGNDTGPMHLISICGCPVVSLFSHLSEPSVSAPRGPHVKVLRGQDMARITPESALTALDDIIRA